MCAHALLGTAVHVLFGVVACGQAGAPTRLANGVDGDSPAGVFSYPPIDEPADLSNTVYALRRAAGQPLPVRAFHGDDERSYLGDTLRFDIAYAARVPGPLSLARSVDREPDGRTATEVSIFRYVQDGALVSFPPTCVPSEACPDRFIRGTLDGQWLTLETVQPRRGPLRYERVG